MPRLNTSGQAVMGIGDGIVSIDGNVIDTQSGGARWFRDGILYQNNANNKSTLIYYDQLTKEKETLSQLGASVIATSLTHWSAFLAGNIPNSGVRLDNDIVTYPASALGDGDLLTNHLMMIDNYQSAQNNLRDLLTNRLYLARDLVEVRASRGYFVYRSGNSIFYQHYLDSEPTKAVSLVGGSSSVFWQNKIWLLYNFDKYLVFHPVDSLIGYVVTTRPAFNPDAVLMTNDEIKVAASLGAGERPEELITFSEADILALPIQDLGKLGNVIPLPGPLPMPNVRPFPRKIWVSSYFSYSLRPGMGDTDDRLGNAQTLVGTEDNGEMISAEIEKYQNLGQPLFISSDRGNPVGNINLTIAWLASGKDITTLEANVNKGLALPEKPVIAYLDSRAWPASRPSFINDRVWPSVMCYRESNETVANFLDNISKVCDTVQSYGRPFFLVLRTDDSNGLFTEAQALELMPIYEHLVRAYDVIGIMMFSDRRGNGMKVFPSLRAWGHAFTNAAERPSRYDYWNSNEVDADFILKEKLKQSTPNIVLTQSEKQKLLKLLGDNSNPVPIPIPIPTPVPIDVEFIKNYILSSPHKGLLGKGNTEDERKTNSYMFCLNNVKDLRSKNYDVGMLFKNTGNNVNERSVDIVCIRFSLMDVIHYDIVVGAEEITAHPAWSEIGPIDFNRFREN